jgi:hypothetical protein
MQFHILSAESSTLSNDLKSISNELKSISNKPQTPQAIEKTKSIISIFNNKNVQKEENIDVDLNDYQKNIRQDQEIAIQMASQLFMTLPSNPIQQRQAQAFVNERVKRTETQRHLQIKAEVRRKAREKQDLDKNLTLLINNISNKITLLNEGQNKNSSLSPIIIDREQKANTMMQKLIQEEEAQIKEKQEEKKQRQQTQKQRNQANSNQKKQASQTKQAPQTKQTAKKKAIKKEPVLSQKDRLSKFALKLYEDPFKGVEHSRIRRWKIMDPNQIRAFEDYVQGEKVLHYENLNDEEIFEQRARHYLPGIECLLKGNVYQKIYTFPTNTGFGMVCQLSYHEETYNGIIYTGINKANTIYHKYFEDVNFTDNTRDLFQDTEQTKQEAKQADLADWQSVNDFVLDISDKGVLNFQYSDHELKVYPLQEKLFKKELAKIK